MMWRVIIILLMLSLTAFAEGFGEYESAISNETGLTYFKNTIGLKNFLFEYDTGLNSDYKNMKTVLKNNHLVELKEDLYYTLNYEIEYNYDFTENKNDSLKLNGELKLAKYINDNFFINNYIYAGFNNYIYISSLQNMYVKPKVQFRFPESEFDINVNGGFRYFTLESRNDYELEISANKNYLSKIYVEIGDYILKTDNVRQNVMKIEYPDIYNENINKLYFYVSYDAVKEEQLIVKVYTKGESIFYFQGSEYENEIYTGTDIQKEFTEIIDLMDISGEYGYNYKDYKISLSVKKYF